MLLRSLGTPDAEVSVLFLGDKAMRSLNKRYRGMDNTTDVLSFPMREGRLSSLRPACGSGRPELLGDIVISVPAAVKQAAQERRSLNREIDRLLVHGLLHLLGYDHERGEREARRMRRKEERLLKGLSS